MPSLPVEQRTAHSVVFNQIRDLSAPIFWAPLSCLFQVLCRWVWGSSPHVTPSRVPFLQPMAVSLGNFILESWVCTRWPRTVLSAPGAFSGPLPFHGNRVAPLPITQGPASTLQLHRRLENSHGAIGGLGRGPPTFSLLSPSSPHSHPGPDGMDVRV